MTILKNMDQWVEKNLRSLTMYLPQCEQPRETIYIILKKYIIRIYIYIYIIPVSSLGCFVSDSVYIHMSAHVRKHMAVRQPFAIDVDKHHKQDWLMEGSFQFSFGARHPAWCGG